MALPISKRQIYLAMIGPTTLSNSNSVRKFSQAVLLGGLACALGLSLLASAPAWAQEDSLAELATNSKSSPAANVWTQQAETVEKEALSEKLSKSISVQVEDVMLEEALRQIAEKGDVELVYGSHSVLSEQTLTLQLDDVSVRMALSRAVDGTELEPMLSSSGYIVLIKESDVSVPQMEQEGGTDFSVEPPNLERAPLALQSSRVQQGTITGTVIDSLSGEPIPGVNVAIAETQQGASTDANGQYRISGVEAGTYTLQASFVGYTTKRKEVEVQTEGSTEVDFELVGSTVSLDDVVVTAFGIERDRESVGYSVSEVEGSDIDKARSANVAQDLSGRVAGVTVNSIGGGVAGSSSNVLIRGVGSLDGDNQPLYVVNGMPISNNQRMQGAFESGASVTDKGDGIQHIDQSNIESISVLKGGAAAALYGSKAANGVVLIETKDGSTQGDGLGVNFRSSIMGGTINVYPDYQEQYGQGFEGRRPQTQEEALSTGRLVYGEKVDGEPTMNFDGVKRPYSVEPIEDRMDEFYRNPVRIENNLSVSGGSENSTYRLGFSRLSEENVQPKSGYDRYGANINMRSNQGDLTIRGMAKYTYDETHDRPIINYAPGNVNWGVSLLANTVPISALSPGYDPETMRETEWQHVAIATNPYFVVNRMSNEDNKNRVMAQASATYDITDNLYVKADIMRDFETWESEYHVPKGTAAIPDGQYRRNEEKSERLNLKANMGYDTNISGIGLSGMVGGNIERVDNTFADFTGVDFIIPEFHSFTNLKATSTNRGITREGTNSVFGSLDVDFQETVYLSFTGRQDWFSTLNPENNSIFYPSIGGSFVLSRVFELPDIVNFARVRASWAQIGSATVDPYAINNTYGLQEGGHLGRPVQTMDSDLTNPDLRPLTSTTREVGFDVELFNDRVGLDVTLYERKNKDDIISTSLAPSSGASSTILNVGEINNKGVEISVSGQPIRMEQFNWESTFNMGYNKNRVVELAPGTPEGGTSLLNRPLSTRFERGKATADDGTPIYNSTTNYALRTEPRPQGPGIPPWNLGMTNTLTYNNFTLNFLLDASFGHVYRSRHLRYMHRFGYLKKTLPGREDGITLNGVDENGNTFEHHWPSELMATYYDHDKVYGELFVIDGDFIKLRSLSLNYSVPQRWVQRFGASSANISLVGRNVAILFSHTNHFDPEQGYNPNSNTQNFSGTQLPRTRKFGVDINISF